MVNWKTASEDDLLLFEVIRSILTHRSHLILFLFQVDKPCLNGKPEDLITASYGFCNSDQILINISLQLWCGCGKIVLRDLFYLDAEVFLKVLKAIECLGPKKTPYNLQAIYSNSFC